MSLRTVSSASAGRARRSTARTQATAHARRERLDDVVVGAGFEPPHAITLFATRGQHDDRQRAGLQATAQPLANGDAERARQHPVEKNEIRLLLLDRQHGFVAIRRDRNVEALAVEVVAKHLGLRVLVFDDEHPRLRQHPLAAAARRLSPGL